MDNVIDLIATDASPHEVSDAIKNLLYAKAAERIDAARPIVATTLFSEDEVNQDQEEEEQEE
jgi:hypothetical protein